MKVDVLGKNGKKVEQIELSDEVFNVVPNEPLLMQYLRVFSFNKRQGTSSTKDKSEVSGGGKKPWRQKGTGRARVGSSRNPLWRHGGIAHGPNPQDWALKMSKKMRRNAIISALSAKFRQDNAILLDGLEMKSPKTKDIQKIMEDLKLSGKSLFVTKEADPAVVKSASNIKNIKVANAKNLNAHELLVAKKVVFVKDAALALQEKYGNKNK